VDQVEFAQRREDDAAPVAERFGKADIERGEFEFDFAVAIARAFDQTAMLEFQLGHHVDAVADFAVDKGDKAVLVEGLFFVVPEEFVIDIAADGSAVGGFAQMGFVSGTIGYGGSLVFGREREGQDQSKDRGQQCVAAPSVTFHKTCALPC